ncbi:MAG: glycosyltransferase family 4 protein [Victivallales bacterium]|nr:glycosyltransferase family 4 protein [Victivallales bacterium]
MKFLLALFKYFPSGGLQKDTLRIAEEAIRRGHDVTLLTTSWDGPPPPNGLEIIRCSVHGLNNHRRMDDFARMFLRIKNQCDYDITLAMNRIPGADFYFVADSCMATWMPQKHSKLALRLLPRYRIYLNHEAAICASDSPTTLLYIANFQKRDYQKIYNLPDNRFIYLPPAMDDRCRRPENAAEIRSRMRHELGLTDDETAIIQIGTNLWRKGVDRVCATIRAMLDQNRNARFILVGGDQEADVAKLVSKYGIDKHFTFLGTRSDVPDLLQAADLMVHPAREEGAGNVLIEAIAAGLPVICTEVCGFSNFVQGATGLAISEPFSQETLNQSVAKAIDSLSQLAAMTIEYAETQSFSGRAEVALDTMEQFAQKRKTDFIQSICAHHQQLTMPHDIVALQEDEGDWRLLNGFALPMAREIIKIHKTQCDNQIWLKNDIKRRVSRVVCNNMSFIVKEFCRDHSLPCLNHGRRTWTYSQKLTGLTAPCLAWLHESSGRSFLIFTDLGMTDLFYPKQLERTSDLPKAYYTAGKILAELHAHGIYHADTKAVNFVINDNLRWASSPSMIIDCDDVHFHRSVSKSHQIKNIAQFLCTMGNLPDDLRKTLATDFQNGYQQTAHLSSAEMTALMEQVTHRMKTDTSLETNLPTGNGKSE